MSRRSPGAGRIGAAVLLAVALCGSARPASQTAAPAAGPLDRLDAAAIPAGERFPWQPPELVAVLGEHRGHHWGRVVDLRVSPDGRRIASAGEDRVARLWDARTLEPLGVLAGHTNAVQGVAWSPDGRRLATGSLDDTVRLWDVGGKEPRPGAVLGGHVNGVTSVAFSADGGMLAAGTGENALRARRGETEGQVFLWDVSVDPPVLRGRVPSRPRVISAVAFAPRGRRLAVAYDDGQVRLWNIRPEPEPAGELAVRGGWVRALAFSPDGRTLAAGALGERLALWDLSGAAPQEQVQLQAPDGLAWAAAFSPDGRRLACANDDLTIRIWDLDAAAPQPGPLLTGHTSVATCLAFLPDGKTLVSGSRDHTVRLWDLTAKLGGERFRQRAHTQGVASLAFSPGGATLATGGGDDGLAVLWDLSGPQPQRSADLGLEETYSVQGLAFSPDGKTLAASGGHNTVHIWDLARPKPEARFILMEHKSTPRSVAFSPRPGRNGDLLAVGLGDPSRAGEAWLWEMGGPEPWRTAVLKGHKGGIRSVGFLPDGKTLASSSWDSTVRLWNTAADPVPAPVVLKGRVEDSYVLTDGAMSIAASGKTLAFANQNHAVQLWDMTASPPVEKRLLTSHTDRVLAVAVSADGRLAASAGDDRRVILWHAESGLPLRSWLLPGTVNSLAFAPAPAGGREYLVLGNDNGTAYVLRLPPPAPPPR